MVRGKCWIEVITIKQSTYFLSQLVLFYFDWYHQYLYQLLINCLCHVLFLYPPTISETNHQNVLIALLGNFSVYIIF